MPSGPEEDVLSGGPGADRLSSIGRRTRGHDLLKGGEGDDHYNVDTADPRVIDSEGHDRDVVSFSRDAASTGAVDVRDGDGHDLVDRVLPGRVHADPGDEIYYVSGVAHTGGTR